MLYLAIYVPSGSAPVSRDILMQPEIAKYAQGWGRAGDFGLIALESVKPIGAVWLRRFAASQPGYGYVAEDIPELSMAILPDYRGQGIGTRLLTDLVAAVGDAPISLSVDPRNAAFHLYERFGFRTVGQSGTSVTMLRSARSSPASGC